MTREEALERFAPRPKWRLERIVDHELAPDSPPKARLTFYQRAANARWARYRAQQLVSPSQIDPEVARQRRAWCERQRKHRALVAEKRRARKALTL
jgi:hypothetical protein